MNQPMKLNPITIRLKPELRQRLLREAERLDLSYSVLARVAITKYLKELPETRLTPAPKMT